MEAPIMRAIVGVLLVAAVSGPDAVEGQQHRQRSARGPLVELLAGVP